MLDAVPEIPFGSSSDFPNCSIRETARRLGIGTTLTRQLIANGELPSIRIERRVLVPHSAIDAFVASRLIARRAESHHTDAGEHEPPVAS